MEFVWQRYLEQTDILCPCRQCLNQTLWPQPEVHDHIHLSGLSSTYTGWIHHGKSLATDIIESSDMHESHFDDWITVVEEDNDNDNRAPDFDLVGELFTEWGGQKPKFEIVLADLKWLVCPGSSHSRFSFLLRLHCIKSHYQISNRAFNALLILLSLAFPRSKLPKTYDEA